MTRRLRTLIPLIFLPLMWTTSAHGQSFSLDEYPADTITISFEYSRPFFDVRPSLSILTGGYNIALHTPITRGINIVARLPFTVLAGRDTSEDGSSAGNVYLGVQTRIRGPEHKGTSISAGISIPTASNRRLLVSSLGLYTDNLHFYRYTPQLMALRINVAFHKRERLNRFHAIHVGAFITIPTGDSEGNMKLWGRYGISAGAWAGDTILSGELMGIVLLNDHIAKFSQRFTHALILAATYDRLVIRPSIFIRLYFDRDLNQTLDAVAGLKCTLPLH